MADKVTKIKLTAEGKKRYEAELNELKTVKRKEIAENLQPVHWVTFPRTANMMKQKTTRQSLKQELRNWKRSSEMLRS